MFEGFADGKEVVPGTSPIEKSADELRWAGRAQSAAFTLGIVRMNMEHQPALVMRGRTCNVCVTWFH